MVRTLVMLLTFCLPAAAFAEEASGASDNREVEFHGGMFVTQPYVESIYPAFPAMRLQTRYLGGEWWFVSGTVSAELGVYAPNVETGEAIGVFGLGAGLGIYGDFNDRFSFHASMNADYLRAQRFGNGSRIGPAAGVTVWLFHLWEHRIALDATVGHHMYAFHGQDPTGALSAGISLSSVLR